MSSINRPFGKVSIPPSSSRDSLISDDRTALSRGTENTRPPIKQDASSASKYHDVGPETGGENAAFPPPHEEEEDEDEAEEYPVEDENPRAMYPQDTTAAHTEEEATPVVSAPPVEEEDEEEVDEEDYDDEDEGANHHEEVPLDYDSIANAAGPLSYPVENQEPAAPIGSIPAMQERRNDQGAYQRSSGSSSSNNNDASTDRSPLNADGETKEAHAETAGQEYPTEEEEDHTDVPAEVMRHHGDEMEMTPRPHHHSPPVLTAGASPQFHPPTDLSGNGSVRGDVTPVAGQNASSIHGRTGVNEDPNQISSVNRRSVPRAKRPSSARDELNPTKVESLLPIDSSRPVERFFVRYDEAGKSDNPLNEEPEPVDEDQLVLEHFAEYTDDDSFFSSSSEVIETEPRRMQINPDRNIATVSVADTLQLRHATKGRMPEELMEDTAARTSWLYQIHHRDISLMHSSFFIFPARMTARVVVYNILHHWLYELILLFVILGYSIFQATWARRSLPLHKDDHMLFADVYYTVIYGVEFLMRLFAYGFILHKRAFFRSPWHWLDTAVMILIIMNCTGWKYLWNFTAWRLIRIVKCFTYLPLPVRMKLMAKTVLRSTNQLAQVSIILFYGIFFFGLLGLQLFMGSLHARCVLDGPPKIVTNQVCRTVANGHFRMYWGFACSPGYRCEDSPEYPNPHFDFRNFDDLGHAMLSTFQIMTFQNWTGLLNDTNNAVAFLAFLYYAFVILFLVFYIPNLFIGVFIEKLEKTNRLYVIKQLELFDAMLMEQKQRLNSAIKLGDFVERDEKGYVRRVQQSYTGASTNPLVIDRNSSGVGNEMMNSDEAERRRKFKKTKWSDEQRVMLHLSLTRQKDVADDAERKRQQLRRMDAAMAAHATSSSSGQARASTPTGANRSRAVSPSMNASAMRPTSTVPNGNVSRSETPSGRPPLATPPPGAAAGNTTSGSVNAANTSSFGLGGRVGEVQHHRNSLAIGPSRNSVLPMARRLDAQQDRLRFLDPYTQQRRSATPDTIARAMSVASGARTSRAASANLDMSNRPLRPVSAMSNTSTSVTRLRESAGVIPNRRASSAVGSIRDGAATPSPSRQRMRPIDSSTMDAKLAQMRMSVAQEERTATPQDQSQHHQQSQQYPASNPAENSHISAVKEVEEIVEPIPLQVHDPEGGDFAYADTCYAKWNIIRNIVHMNTEGYPRILTQYLWEHKMMQQRYGLTPLNYVNRYEEDAVRKLRRKQEEARQRYEAGEDDGQNGASQWQNIVGFDGVSDMGSKRSPIEMTKSIIANAPLTWFQWLFVFLTFANAVFNASRHADQPENWDRGLFIVSVIFSALFLLGLIARIVALGPLPFFTDIYNFVELIVVIISFFELGFSQSNTITVFNWLRCVRYFSVIPIRPLRKVTRVLVLGFQECLYAIIIFNVYIFMWLLIGMSFFGGRFGPFTADRGNYPTWGDFDTFSHAMFSIAQSFSYTRDQWATLSSYGMRARGGYTIMYFLATVGTTFIFRFLFIAIYTWAWECEEEQDDYGFQRNNRKSRLHWFDFTVWRSFKHIHGGFERRDVAPDEVYQLNLDMRRQLRLAEARDRYFRENYTFNPGQQRIVTLEQRQRNDSLFPDAPFYNMGGQIQRRMTYQDSDTPPPPLRFVEYQANNAQLRFARRRTTALLYNGEGSGAPGHMQVDYIDPSAPNGAGAEAPINGSDFNYNAQFNPASAFNGPEDWTGTGGRNNVSGAATPQRSGRMRAASVLMPVVTFENSIAPMANGGENSSAPTGPAFFEHQLLSGPLFRYKSVMEGRRRVFDRCVDCGAHKQIALRASPGVEQRSADDLHAEHCHMAAIRMSRQLVLNAISGYVLLQIENNIPPSQNAIETVLGQAWSCGMLMFETIENLTTYEPQNKSQCWEGVLKALELQQWLLNLRIGEEQVGRAALAYELAHKRLEEKKVTEEGTFQKTWQERSFLCLTRQNPVRRFFIAVTESVFFEWFILFVIYAASICFCFYIPYADLSRGKYKALHILDDIFTVIFAIEMVMKWIAMGVVLDVGRAYFWHLWNIVDCFIVCISIASWAKASLGLRYLKVMRCFRILIPIRHWKWNRNLAKLAVAMYDSVPTLANILLLCLINYIVWAIIAVQLFGGKMSYCANSAYTSKAACLANVVNAAGVSSPVSRWIPFQRNFDNFYESLLTMFEISTGSKWTDILNQGMAAWSNDFAPIISRRPYKALIFIPFYYVSNFVLFSLLIGGMVYCYLIAKNAMEGSWGLTYEQQLWMRMQKMLLKIKPRKGIVPLNNVVSNILHKAVSHVAFECVMVLILFFNMITMALYWHTMNNKQKDALDILQYIWVALFTIEVILRLVAYGPRFFTRWEYCFDLFIVCLSYLQIGLNTTNNHKVPFNVNVLRMMRLGRVLKVVELLLPFHTHLRLLHRVLLYSLPGIVNVTLIYIVAVYVFAILGLHFAGSVTPVVSTPPMAGLTPYPNLPLGLPIPSHDYAGYIDYFHNNFATFPNALVMVLRLSTLEDWTSMLRDNLNHVSQCYYETPCGRSNFAPVFYIPIVICFYLMIITLYAAVVVDNYVTVVRMETSISRMDDLRRFVALWNRLDPHGTLVIPTRKLATLLEQLRPPLGISRRTNRLELLLLLEEYRIPDHGGKVHFYEVLLPLARRIMAMAFTKDNGSAISATDFASNSYSGSLFRDEEEAYAATWKVKERSLRALPNTYIRYDVATTAQYFAASYIQAAYRRDKAMRRMPTRLAEMWEEGRRSCDELQLPYEQFGFGAVNLGDEDPRQDPHAAEVYGTTPFPGGDETGSIGGLHDSRNVSPSRNQAGDSATKSLPGQYRSAIHTDRAFGPDAPNAVRRHEKRSEKLRRKSEMQAMSTDGTSAGSGMGQRQSLATDADTASSKLYQPPLGSNPAAWREMEMNRRTSGAVPPQSANADEMEDQHAFDDSTPSRQHPGHDDEGAYGNAVDVDQVHHAQHDHSGDDDDDEELAEL